MRPNPPNIPPAQHSHGDEKAQVANDHRDEKRTSGDSLKEEARDSETSRDYQPGG